MRNNGDRYNRVKSGPDTYQCGCHWIKHPEFGDVLRQCPLHQAHTEAAVARFEREQKALEIQNITVPLFTA